jgi:hypothetical protein
MILGFFVIAAKVAKKQQQQQFKVAKEAPVIESSLEKKSS